MEQLGWVEFRVKLSGNIETYTLSIVPLHARCQIGNCSANGSNTIKAVEFIAQRGMVAYLEVKDYNARCKVIDYELLRIGQDGTISRQFNKGAAFETPSKAIIQQASAGDLYIFRNIHYFCPHGEPQQAADILLDIQ